MKTLKEKLSVEELQKLLALWHSRGITDATVTKLLRLYLGSTAYMNVYGYYPTHNLYDLATSMGFRNITALLVAVKQCTSFILFENEGEQQTLTGFGSPLWCKKDIDTDTEKPPAICQLSPAICQVDNIYNNISKGDASEKASSPTGDAEKNSVTTETATEAVREFFHSINTNEAEKAAILTPQIDHFQKNERLTRENARKVVVRLVNEFLVPYYAARPKFLQSDYAGRRAWLVNLLKSDHGNRLKNEAAQACRLQREAAVKCTRENLRNNRPLSPYEWTHPETGQRYYDDPVEGTLPIPLGAPPRMSEEAIWNNVSNEWT